MPVPAARSPHLAAAESGQASGPAPAAGLPGPAAPVASGRSPGPGPPASGECPLPPPRSQRTAAALFVRGGGAARSRPFARCPCGQTARPSRRSPGAALPLSRRRGGRPGLCPPLRPGEGAVVVAVGSRVVGRDAGEFRGVGEDRAGRCL